MGLDINTFSWPQLFSNNDGKTSGSGFLGVIIGITGCVVFLLGAVDTIFITKGSIVINSAVTVIGIGAAVLVGRKFITRKEPKSIEESQEASDTSTEEIVK